MLQCIWQPPIICNGQYWLPPLHITQYAAAMHWCGGPNPLFLMFCNHICHIWYLDSCHEQLWCGGSNALSVMFCIHICCIWYLDSCHEQLWCGGPNSLSVMFCYHICHIWDLDSCREQLYCVVVTFWIRVKDCYYRRRWLYTPRNSQYSLQCFILLLLFFVVLVRGKMTTPFMCALPRRFACNACRKFLKTCPDSWRFWPPLLRQAICQFMPKRLRNFRYGYYDRLS